jgi:ribonucleoside-diphosphate reductase alpha chain
MAPTSTLANVFNHVNPEGCSYGLEPYFSVGEHMVKNSYGEFIKKDKIVEALNGDTAHIETANQLSWRGHVGVLEAVAKAWLPGTGMCISKTINFKENISLDEYKEAVLYCWRAGLKSVSFYRDGSRKDQVINVGKTDEAGKSKRPTSVPCDIYHTTCEGQKWLVCVGMNEGQPYEVFAGLQSTVLLPKTYTKGRIVKGKGKKYNLHVGEGDNELVIQDLPTAFANPVHASQTRVLSFCLRHKAPLNFLVDQLQKDGDMNSFSKVISRILKKYVAESAKSGHKCECGAHMQYVSGCLSCPACGKSLCG